MNDKLGEARCFIMTAKKNKSDAKVWALDIITDEQRDGTCKFQIRNDTQITANKKKHISILI